MTGPDGGKLSSATGINSKAAGVWDATGSSGRSLWGSKAVFSGRHCSAGYWQLAEGRSVPALDELSVCVALSRRITSPKWTAFTYKQQGGTRVELGLAGVAGAARLAVRSVLEARLNETAPGQPCCPAANGTLTLGASHGFANGQVVVETGSNFLGEMSLFRMWGRGGGQLQLLGGRRGAMGLPGLGHAGLPPSLMLVCSALTTTFPSNISVLTISVSPSARNHSLHAQNTEGDQERRPFLKAPVKVRFECLVYVSVTPSIDVSEAQAEICRLLSVKYSNEMLTLNTEPNSTRVNPVEALPTATPLPSNSPGNTTAFTDPASSAPTEPEVSAVTGSPAVTLPTAASSFSPSSASSEPGHPWTDKGQKSSDIFFMVILNVIVMSGSQDPAETIQTWLRNTLEFEWMLVLNFALLAKAHSQMPSIFEHGIPGMYKTSMPMQPSHGCSFQVCVHRPQFNITETAELISGLLIRPYTNGSVSVEARPEEITITYIEPGWCPERAELTERGLYVWPQTEALGRVSQPCKGAATEEASRVCGVNGTTGKATWDPPDLQLCPSVETTISDLSQINITANNSVDMVDIIGDLMGNSMHLPLSLVEIVLDKLVEVVNVSQVSSSMASDMVSIIDDILQHGSDLSSVTNKILNITGSIGDKVLCDGSAYNTTTPSLALSLVNVNSSQFDGLTFGVSSFSHGLDPKIYINEKLLNDMVAFISLPQEVEDFFPQGEGTQSRIQFQFYGTPDLFQDPGNGLELYTHVVSASITNATRDIKDLEQSVRVTLHHHTPNEHKDKVECVFWNFHSNGNRGGWDNTGCERNSTTANHTTCLCNHLTHFAVLVDMSRYKLSKKDERILSVISNLGCGVSSVFLGISLLTYSAFEKLRRDYPSKILINLSLALLGLNLVFLVNSWLSSYGNVLCVAVAATLHYFTLASFTWMGLEAVHMYLALVKVFNVYVPSYMFKFCILGWGVPLVIVGTVLAVTPEAYGSKLYEDSPESPVSTEQFCWVQHNVVFYVSVVTYIFLILICNISVFGLVLVQIRKMQVNRPAGTQNGLSQDLRSVASLTFLLGLTWMLAFFSWEPFKVPLFYLFAVLNSLQGFFLFLFYCLMKENVRKQWRVHLCCGRFRLNDQSGSTDLLFT
ncbi:hypothetical protein ANANG_G00069230 [Anguilla anguilla]|uniref:Uncharacterized protein n=1 Tax=Anguilla anguilla TaxID=7936 RepID=A0A9D3MSD4_ANGAN|nr:hypothetical protein ANANG_G00069230 [Anguilla anguilla]